MKAVAVGILQRLRRDGFRALGVERALLVAFAARAWQSLAGLATLYFVITYFPPEVQGYHQTFLSLLVLQAFFELGIMQVVVSVVSHEWAGLSLAPAGSIEGSAEKLGRLGSTTRFVFFWFLAAAVLFLVIGGVVGGVVLMQHGQPDLWLGPWLLVIALASSFLWCQGLIGVLEGCNQILPVATFRLVQAVASVTALWLAIASGWGLWSLTAALGTTLVIACVFLFWIYARFFRQLLADRSPSTFNWKIDMWPMQWPLALQGIAGFFMLSLFVPVICTSHGPVAAGQMGLSMQVVMAVTGISTTWLSVQAPRMGTLFAAGKVSAYESMWFRAAAVSAAFLTAASFTMIGIVWLGAASDLAVADRFLGPVAFTLLIGWGLAQHVMQCSATYWRAQRIELLGFWGLVPGAVTGLAVWQLGRQFGATGATGGALLAASVVMVPLCIYYFVQARHRAARMRATEAEPSRA